MGYSKNAGYKHFSFSHIVFKSVFLLVLKTQDRPVIGLINSFPNDKF